MMLRKQCNMQGLVCEISLFLSQLRLVPKVGQGVNYSERVFRYDRITIYLQKNKYTNTYNKEC
jgi:hypothetical protein